MEKNQTSATTVTMHPLVQGIWEDIWQSTMKKFKQVSLPAPPSFHPNLQIVPKVVEDDKTMQEKQKNAIKLPKFWKFPKSCNKMAKIAKI